MYDFNALIVSLSQTFVSWSSQTRLSWISMLRTQKRPRGNPQRRRSESLENDQFALFEAPCRGQAIVNLGEGRQPVMASQEHQWTARISPRPTISALPYFTTRKFLVMFEIYSSRDLAKPRERVNVNFTKFPENLCTRQTVDALMNKW